MAEPPYGVIWNRLKAGRVVPFLGAGASVGHRPADAAWRAQQPEFLPSGAELATLLANEARYPSNDEVDRRDLAKVSSYYGDVAGRRALRERLRDVFLHEFSPGPVHRLLAAVPHPLLIVATNYDTLMEQAFRDAGRPYELVIHSADRKGLAGSVLWWPHGEPEPRPVEPSELDRHIDLDTATVLYKMHGSVVAKSSDWDNFVITEEDYVDFLSRMSANQAVPAMFYSHCRDRSLLFLGYSLRDWNLRVILKNLNKAFSRHATGDDDERVPSWAIQSHPSELESRLWEKRNVTIFDLEIDAFAAKLLEETGLPK